jgi:hypothetical protein
MGNLDEENMCVGELGRTPMALWYSYWSLSNSRPNKQQRRQRGKVRSRERERNPQNVPRGPWSLQTSYLASKKVVALLLLLHFLM